MNRADDKGIVSTPLSKELMDADVVTAAAQTRADDRAKRGQCRAEHIVDGEIWYCVLDSNHTGAHVDDARRHFLNDASKLRQKPAAALGEK